MVLGRCRYVAQSGVCVCVCVCVRMYAPGPKARKCFSPCDCNQCPMPHRRGVRDGVVPSGSLRRRSWAACAAVVWRVWTRSLMRPVSRTVRLLTGDSAGAPGLFCVDADTAPFGSEDATPGSCASVRVRVHLGLVRRAGLPGALWCSSPFPLAGLAALFVCSAPSGLGRPFFLLVRPGCLWRSLFSGPGCLALVSSFPPPPPFFSPPPFFLRPRCLWRSMFSGPGCPGPWRLLVSRPPPF